jgi:predicted nuclease of predicted toxin-antitoxin system
MTLWVDAHLSPAIARWVSSEFAMEAIAVRELGMRSTKDYDIFVAAREAQAVILTKDSDFLDLLAVHGPPPKVIWLTCGNTSNARLRVILKATLALAIERLDAGESMVEITDVSA